MADDKPLIQVVFASEAALQVQVQGFPDELSRQMQGKLQTVGQDTVKQVQALIRQPPRSGGAMRDEWLPHNSREQAAQGVAATVKGSSGNAELTVTVSSSHMAPGRQAFPFAYNKPTWSHPVFGWSSRVTQQGNPYLDAGQKLAGDQASKALDDAMGAAGETIKGGE